MADSKGANRRSSAFNNEVILEQETQPLTGACRLACPVDCDVRVDDVARTLELVSSGNPDERLTFR